MKSTITRHIPKWVLIVSLLVGLGAVTTFAIWLPRYTTSNPNYCLSCHGDEGGLPNRGIPSEVHPPYSQVSCVQCHGRHGQLVFEGYRKGFMAEPERISPNCLSCHTGMATKKDETNFKFNVF